MQVTILSGSRNPEGRTAEAIKAIGEGVEKGGGLNEVFFLPTLKLERCRQCESNGWGICRREAYCLIEDDFPMLVDKIKASDVVVFATPVYFADLSESMRSFLDRLRRIWAFMEGRPSPEISAVGLCLAGGGGGGAPSACLNLERILQMCGFDIVDMIAMRRQNFDSKLPRLKLAGEWLATKPTSK